MGMFDYVFYKELQYQSKDTPAQLLDNYKIEQDQTDNNWYLWYEEYDAEWVDGEGIFGGGLKKFNERWVRCDGFDGLIRFYREDAERGGYKADAWIEYKALFMNGQMIKLTQTDGEALTMWLKSGIVETIKETK
jgi:hypothetical protein